MVSCHPVKFSGYKNCDSEDLIFLICHVISRDSRSMQLYKQEGLKESHHPAKSVGHRQCGSGDILILVCHGNNHQVNV